VNADWHARVAGPALTAAKRGIAEGLDAFAAQAADDRVVIEAAVGTLERELGEAHATFAQRKAEINGTTFIGVAIGFGFMTVAFGVALVSDRRFGHALERDARDSSVLNRFTEVTSFASDDRERRRPTWPPWGDWPARMRPLPTSSTARWTVRFRKRRRATQSPTSYRSVR
jgi:hypothetical protein